MSLSDFSNDLLRSASKDAPSVGSKKRAIEHIERALGGIVKTTTASTAATAVRSMTTTKAVWLASVAAMGAAALGFGGGYKWSRATTARGPAQDSGRSVAQTSQGNEARAGGSAENSPAPSIAPQASELAKPPRSSPAKTDRPTDVCRATTIISSGTCSTRGKGHSVTFALKSDCSDAVLDLFWVNESCKEIFRGTIAPSELHWHDSRDTHAFRLRDHETHQLVKEFVPAAIGGAPDRDQYWKGPPTKLPPVTIHEGDLPIAEAPPPVCMHGGGRAARLHVRNERKDGPVTVMRVDGDCKERVSAFVEPGKSHETRGSEGHPFRIRNVSGALLLDILPTSEDTTTYLSVP